MHKDIIIIPTYNEKENVSILIGEIFNILPEVYVVIVDDNSPDGTGKIVESLKIKFPRLRVLHRKNKDGLGKAYMHAFTEVLKNKDIRFIVMMDADLSHNPYYLKEMFKKGHEHDVIIGSRYVVGGSIEGWELWRKILSFWGNFYCRIITRMPIFDCTGGFNIIRAEMLRKLNLSELDMSGYAFIMELKYALFKLEARFVEVPILFKNRTGGESKISNHIISEGIRAPWKMIMKK